MKRVTDLIVYSDQFGAECWKPSPVPFQKVMDFFNFPGKDCVYIGDNLNKDFIAPNRLGWLTVRVKRERGIYHDLAADLPYEAGIVANSLIDLGDMFLK